MPPQSSASAHTGAASPGVTQKPPEQTMASPHRQQSELVAQLVRQAPFTHMRPPPPQSLFALHEGRGRSSARHSPLTQRSSGPQLASLVQAARQ